jgi:hypothetical protein
MFKFIAIFITMVLLLIFLVFCVVFLYFICLFSVPNGNVPSWFWFSLMFNYNNAAHPIIYYAYHNKTPCVSNPKYPLVVQIFKVIHFVE